jgi:thioesterase domain-containing protein/acyl carrier protein
LQNTVDKQLAMLSQDQQVLLAARLGRSPTDQSHAHQHLVGYVTLKHNTDATELRAYLQQRVPHYMIPSQFVVLEAFPRTPNGKLDVSALKQSAAQTAASALPEPAPMQGEADLDAVETKLTAIWAALIGNKQIRPHDDFFALGGHSLLAIRMLAQVKAAFGVEIPVSAIVDAPTIATLAEHIRDATSNVRASSIVAIQTSGHAPALYFLPLHMHGALHYRHVKPFLGSARPLYSFEAFDVLQSQVLPTVEALAKRYVDDLLRFQPHGPYYLIGISIAGLIAFEMARLLHKRGITNVEVFLLDTHGPNYPETASLAASVQQMLTPTRAMDMLDRVMSTGEKLYSNLKQRRAAYIHGRVHQDQSTFTVNTNPDFAIDAVNTRLGEMTREYLTIPRTYNGTIFLFRANLQPWRAKFSSTLGWNAFVRGKIRMIAVRGDHLGILRRRLVKDLAALLQQSLLECDVRYETSQS